MRTIKFRGKRLDNGEWVYGDLEIRRIDMRCFIHTYNDDGTYFRQFEVIPETVGQFIGIEDNYNHDVYEGDIIECKAFKHIAWDEDNFVSENRNRAMAMVLERNYLEVKKILAEHRDLLDRMATELLNRTTLLYSDIQKICAHVS